MLALLVVVGLCRADIIEWGGIDSPVNTARTTYGGVSMDNAATIFPAAVFHGALSIDGGDLVLDSFSDVIVTGMNETLRELIRGQWKLFAFMCNRSCPADQHVSMDCVCVCDVAGFAVKDTLCVFDCNGHGQSTGLACTCDVPYTAASQCMFISCAEGTYLMGEVCRDVPPVVPESAWPCMRPETAGQCPRRGNWLAVFEDANQTACAPIVRWPVVLLSACAGSGCCAMPDSWWAIDCMTDASMYCDRFVRSTFDLWDDGLEHVLLVAAGGNGVPLVTTLWLASASAVMCVAVTPAASSALTRIWFERVLAVNDTMYGAVYRIWNSGYCWLDRPLGQDERIMYKTSCTGLVALAGPPAACGSFVVLDGTIQPYASALRINWAQQSFGGAYGEVWPLPATTLWANPIPYYDTHSCRTQDCVGSASPVCAPCIYVHGL